jgi:hypothetical protein
MIDLRKLCNASKEGGGGEPVPSPPIADPPEHTSTAEPSTAARANRARKDSLKVK